MSTFTEILGKKGWYVSKNSRVASTKCNYSFKALDNIIILYFKGFWNCKNITNIILTSSVFVLAQYLKGVPRAVSVHRWPILQNNYKDPTMVLLLLQKT